MKSSRRGTPRRESLSLLKVLGTFFAFFVRKNSPGFLHFLFEIAIIPSGRVLCSKNIWSTASSISYFFMPRNSSFFMPIGYDFSPAGANKNKIELVSLRTRQLLGSTMALTNL